MKKTRVQMVIDLLDHTPMTAEQKKNRDNLGFAIIASRAAMAKIEHLIVCINQDMGLHIPGNPGEKFDDEIIFGCSKPMGICINQRLFQQRNRK